MARRGEKKTHIETAYDYGTKLSPPLQENAVNSNRVMGQVLLIMEITVSPKSQT